MSNGSIFNAQGDYEAPLLRLLCKLPGRQGEAAEVCRLFETEYKEHIPEAHRVTRKSTGDLLWRNNVRWCRNYLRERGFLDMPRHGIWRVTDEGRRWAEENPSAERLPPFRRKSSKPRTRSSGGMRMKAPAGITLDMLELTRKSMPADQFRQIWGVLYDQLVAEERARAITQVTQTELGRRARRKVDEIQAFLRGQSNASPKSDVLCDWIHFCYELELFREAASLLQYVAEEETDPAIYRRAKRLAEVSRVKLGW